MFNQLWELYFATLAPPVFGVLEKLYFTSPCLFNGVSKMALGSCLMDILKLDI